MVDEMLNYNFCMVCKDSISDPVCRGCYLKQIEILLNDFSIHEMAKEVILRRIKNSFPVQDINDTECVLCKKEKVTICRYCFATLLRNILRELNFTEDVIENFGYNPEYEEFPLKHDHIHEIEVIIK